MPSKRPNQTDATLRNVRAAAARTNGVAKRLAKLHERQQKEINRLSQRVILLTGSLAKTNRLMNDLRLLVDRNLGNFGK